MNNQNRQRSIRQQLSQSVSQLRRQVCEHSLQRFANAYLAHYFKDPPSSMHVEMFGLLEKAIDHRGTRLAIAAPRGHAKSTIVSQAYVLWCICYEKEPFILLICSTLDQSADLLSQIKNELTNNSRLMEDFPQACEPSGELPGAGAPRWRKEEIITRNNIKVTALGAGKAVRGRKHNQHRPRLIILDDMENEEEVRSDDQRKFKREWFNKTVLKAGEPQTNVIVVGTVLHFDSLLANLIDTRKSPGWESRKFQAVTKWSDHPELWSNWELIFGHNQKYQDQSGPEAAWAYFEANRAEMLEGTDVLWPQRESYAQLMLWRLTEGRASFNSEKQNEPVNPEDCLFEESHFRYWEDAFPDEQALLDSMKGHYSIFGACDPSMGKKGKGNDDSAIISVARNTRTGVLYVLDADIRRRKPDQIIDDVIRFHEIRRYSGFALESNQFQELLCDELSKRSRQSGAYVPLRNLTNTTDKIGRIQSLQPLISTGQLVMSRRHVRLLDQLREFPMGAHDDGPDALEMAIRIASGSPAPLRIEPIPKPHPFAMLYDTDTWRRKLERFAR